MGKNICFAPQFPISFFWCLSFLLICIYSFQDEQQNGTFDTLNTCKRSVLITFSVKLHKGKQFLWKGFKRVKIFHSSPKSLLKTLEKISGPEGLWVISFNLKIEGHTKCIMTLQHFLPHTLKIWTPMLLCAEIHPGTNPYDFYLHFLTHSLTYIQRL